MNLEDVPADEASDVEEWLAVVKYREDYFSIAATLGELILDYHRYDPQYEPSDPARFRDGLLTVTTETAPKFLRALSARILDREDIADIITGPTEPELLAFIDFDAQRYVHSYHDLPLETYVPRGWRGVLGDPRAAVQEQTRES